MLLKAESPFYEDLGSELAEMRISVDLIVATQQPFIDAATMMRLPRACGGRSYLTQNFDMRKDDVCVRNSIVRAVWGVRAMEAMVRVRVSQGLTTGEYLGSFGRPQRRSDISVPVMGVDSVLIVALSHEGQFPESATGNAGMSSVSAHNNPCIQCAVLYTDVAGRRKIRVHSMYAPKTTVLQKLFQSVDLDALVALMAMRAATAAFSGGKLLSKVREAVLEKAAHILYIYRKFCYVAAAHSGQLILPPTLKLLPVTILGLLKSTAFRPLPAAGSHSTAGDTIGPDERAYALIFLGNGKPQDIMTYCYPRMMSLVNIPEEAGVSDDPLLLHRFTASWPLVFKPAKPKVSLAYWFRFCGWEFLLLLPFSWLAQVPLPSIEGLSGVQEPIELPPSMTLSSEHLDDTQMFLVDTAQKLVVWIGPAVAQELLQDVFDMNFVPNGYRLNFSESGRSKPGDTSDAQTHPLRLKAHTVALVTDALPLHHQN